MSTDVKHLGYIDALRGYAILGVIAVHASQAVPELDRPLRLLADQGARGVQLFFVVSALTLILSWHERADGVAAFYIRRVFRIAPMFWLAMAFFAAVEISGLPIRYWPPLDISWPNILASATFTHGFHPQAIGGVVPGGWSIADEMTFYVLLPLLVISLRSAMATALTLAASICLTTLAYGLMVRGFVASGQDRELVSKFAVLWFPNQFPAFLTGIMVFHLLRRWSGLLASHVIRAGLAVSIVAMIAIPFVAFWLQGRIAFVMFFMPIVYPFAFGLATFCLAQGAGRLVVNAPIRYIGKVSYSAYFWHFPVLGGIVLSGIVPFEAGKLVPSWLHFLLIFAAATAMTVAVAAVTYDFIEAPMIRLGRRLARKAAARQPAVVTAYRPSE